jgi:tetratricopeptide (TPR) repeat protein
LGENLRALSDNDKALDLEPNQPLAFVNRGLAMHGLGDDAGALAAIKGALELAPGFPPALDALKQIGAPKDAAQSRRAKETRSGGGLNPSECMIPVADIQLDPKSIDRVLQACTSLINSGGGNADDRSLAFLQRGSMYRRQQKYELAVADFDQSIRYDPKSAGAYTGRGNALRSLGRLDESVAAHSEAIRLEPNNAMAYSNRGNALGDKKDYEHAIADFDTAIKIDPKYATAFYNRARTKLDAGDKSGAVEDFRQALAFRPGFKEAADMLEQLGVK